MRPIFNYSDQTLDVLLQIITLVNYSDELDTLDYINTQNEKVLPNSIKALLIDSVTTHFSQIEPVDEVVSGDESSEIMADDDFLDGERLIDLGRRGESDDKYLDDAPPVIDPNPLNEDELPQL